MKLHYLFYIIGVIFIFSSVIYFSKEFIRDLPDAVKMIILVASVITSFIVAELLRGGDL